MIVYLNLYCIQFPANLMIFNTEFQKVIEFESLNPEKLYQMIDPKFTVERLLSGDYTYTEKTDSSFMDELKPILIFVTFALVMLALSSLFVKIFTRYRAKFEEKYDIFFQAFFWNGLLISLQIVYLKQCFAMSKQFQLARDGKTVTTSAMVGAWVLMVYHIGLVIHVSSLLHRKRESLELPRCEWKFGVLYKGIKMRKYALWYFPLFFVRRLIFTMIPVFFVSLWAQIQTLLVLNLTYLVYLVTVRPHRTNNRRYLENFNEFIMMIIFYHILLFSDFVSDLNL